MYNILSGQRRSGTSMLILALRQSGIPVIGMKYPMNDLPVPKERKEGNPNGFWELQGITSDIGLESKFEDIGMKGDLIKIITECLYKSDPKLISKVVMTFREPSNVIASILKHNNIPELDLYIIQQCVDIADSLDYCQYNNIPVKPVIYERILKNPLEEITKVCEFLDSGDPKKGAEIIKQGLNRSKGKKYKGIGWLENIYAMAKEDNIQGIIDYKPMLFEAFKNMLESYKKRGQKVVGKATPKK